MLFDLINEFGCFLGQTTQIGSLFQYLQMLVLLGQTLQIFNLGLDFILELVQRLESVCREVLRGRLVILHGLKIFDNVLSLDFLLVYDDLERIVLLVDLSDDFLFETLSLGVVFLHIGHVSNCLTYLLKDTLKLGYLVVCRHL